MVIAFIRIQIHRYENDRNLFEASHYDTDTWFWSRYKVSTASCPAVRRSNDFGICPWGNQIEPTVITYMYLQFFLEPSRFQNLSLPHDSGPITLLARSVVGYFVFLPFSRFLVNDVTPGWNLRYHIQDNITFQFSTLDRGAKSTSIAKCLIMFSISSKYVQVMSSESNILTILKIKKYLRYFSSVDKRHCYYQLIIKGLILTS